ncbi:MAG TPA: PASTA domain-containing protein, partial [Terriglobales bacterium]|nr:PASTA domain-containing protein [Terriglobales bacterium]
IELAETTSSGPPVLTDNTGSGVLARQTTTTPKDGRDANRSTNQIVPAAMREPASAPIPMPVDTTQTAAPSPSGTLPTNGTVVMEVEQGGIVVPSFLGKSVRSSIELAESSGLDLNIVGSGLARDQSPSPGAHVPSGAKITVQFGR